MMSRVCTAYDARSIITGPAGSENLISSAGICELLCTHVINRKRLLTQTRLFHTHTLRDASCSLHTSPFRSFYFEEEFLIKRVCLL